MFYLTEICVNLLFVTHDLQSTLKLIFSQPELTAN